MLNETRDGEMRNTKLKTTFAWELMGAKKNSRSEQKQSIAEHGKMFFNGGSTVQSGNA